MKRISRLVALASSAVAILLAGPMTQAQADITSPTTWDQSGGCGMFSHVQLSWLNRSVGVSGSVRSDVSGCSAQVRFSFYVGTSLIDSQTRTATNTTKTFGWTEDGSAYVGGITRVGLALCDQNNHCSATEYLNR
jgi:hypothetical protein